MTPEFWKAAEEASDSEFEQMFTAEERNLSAPFGRSLKKSSEADEIDPQDLEAAAEMHDKVVRVAPNAALVDAIFRDSYGVTVDPSTVNSILAAYADCPSALEAVIEKRIAAGLVKEMSAVCAVDIMIKENKKPKPKPYLVRVNLDVYFEIDPDGLPPWANDLGVEKLAECAFDDFNQPLTLENLGTVLLSQPVEISRNTVSIA